jgi:1,4-dihydroxy-2-naphthoate octaprenyltransferase
MLGGALLTTAIYPLTQLYQIAEDKQRGDLTLTRWLGSSGTCITVSLLLLTAAACIGYTFWSLGDRITCVLMTAYFVFAVGMIALLFRFMPSLTARQIYRRVMAFNYVNAALLLLVLAFHKLAE